MSYAKRSYPKMTPGSTFYENYLGKPKINRKRLSPICQYTKNSKYAHPPHPSEYEASASTLATKHSIFSCTAKYVPDHTNTQHREFLI
eukprot:scaffold36495_cov51-Attheya_sp.AAC.1